MAYECLKTIPNKPEDATKFMASLKAFSQWQSTLAWLKDPPPSYKFAPTDILAGFDNITATVAAKKYTNEYDFQLDVVKLVVTARDGHFAFRPDVFKIFGFRVRELKDMVSVSIDGKQLPKLYHFGKCSLLMCRSWGSV